MPLTKQTQTEKRTSALDKRLQEEYQSATDGTKNAYRFFFGDRPEFEEPKRSEQSTQNNVQALSGITLIIK